MVHTKNYYYGSWKIIIMIHTIIIILVHSKIIIMVHPKDYYYSSYNNYYSGCHKLLFRFVINYYSGL
jgi:hypothetical protein